MNLINRFFEKNTQTLIRPFVYKNSSVFSDSKKIILLLLLQVFFLWMSKSYSSCLVILASVIASVLASFVSSKIFEDKFFDSFSLLINIAQGMIIGFLLPSNYPLHCVFIVTLCAMLSIKYFFCGFSYSWVNPCVLIVVVLWIIGASVFPELEITHELLLMRNPSLHLIESGYFKIYSFDQTWTASFNNSIFNLFGVTVPDGYISLLWDSGSQIPAFRFNFLTLISSIVLFCDDSVKNIIPSIFLFVYLIMIRFLTPIFFGGLFASGDILLALLSSGTLFTAVFVLSWYGTTPVSILGKISYGIIAGILAFFICGCGTSSIGMVFTVLIANIISLLIQQWENRRDRFRIQKILMSAKK